MLCVRGNGGLLESLSRRHGWLCPMQRSIPAIGPSAETWPSQAPREHLARCWAACLVMKFGKTLAVRIKPALREHAIDYKALKRQIRHVVEELR